MSKKTSNYQLVKLELSDPADITALNENWDKLDSELKQRATLDSTGKVREEQLPDITNIPITSDIPSGADIWLDPDEETVEENHVLDRNNPHKVTREQIGAAPSGFGLGTTELDYGDDIDNLFENGWYMYDGESILGDDNPNLGYGFLTVQGCDGNGTFMVVRQTFFPTYIGVGHLVREYGFDMNNDEWCWGEWEWVNPQIATGEEYRTTEKWLGKPVYTKAVYLGYLTGNGKIVDVGVNYANVLDLKVIAYGGSFSTVLPMYGSATIYAYAFMEGTKVSVSLPKDCSSNYAYAVIKYTK